ncbi:MAG TPA: TIGR03618 family F420-dependent PPOX class oxidoreductase, partial [Ilumatobacteraceae bacterium]|nr:TIGR03618 family F420-dependent PPOX class oxidoreductase [Ilumatobacteraceae bacterium]
MLPEISPALREFLTERHLAALITTRADGTPHSVPVGFTVHDGVARVITSGGSVKVANVRRNGWATITQIDGRRWVTIEGPARVLDNPQDVALAVQLYEQRYRQPRE